MARGENEVDVRAEEGPRTFTLELYLYVLSLRLHLKIAKQSKKVELVLKRY